jgi:hypothetical protein
MRDAIRHYLALRLNEMSIRNTIRPGLKADLSIVDRDLKELVLELSQELRFDFDDYLPCVGSG